MKDNKKRLSVGQTEFERPTAAPVREWVEVDVPMLDVIPDPDNRDLDPKVVKERADSIEAVGLTNRVPLFKEGDKYHILDGHYRHAAVDLLKWPKLPGRYDPKMTWPEAERFKLHANNQSLHDTPYEEALKWSRALTKRDDQEKPLYESVEALAVDLRKSVGTVKNRLVLAKLPPIIGKAVNERSFTQAHAKVILPLAEHPELLAAVMSRLKSWGDDIPRAQDFGREAASVLLEKKLVIALKPYDFQGQALAAVERKLAEVPNVAFNGFTYYTDLDAFNAIVKEAKARKKEREQKQREDARSAAKAEADEPEEPEADPAVVERRVDAAEDAEVDSQVLKALDEGNVPYILLRWGWPNDNWVELALKHIERVNKLCGFDAKPLLLEFLGLPADTDPTQFTWDAANADYVARLKTPGPIAKKLKTEQAQRLTLAFAVIQNNPCVLDSLTERTRDEWDAWREKTQKRVEKEVLAEAKKAAKAAAKAAKTEGADEEEAEANAAA